MARGRKTLQPAEQQGPEFVGATPQDMAQEEKSARAALALVQSNAATLAQQLGYEGALTVGCLEDEIRFYQRQSVMALLECGKRLLLLKEVTPHGEFGQRVELLGFQIRTAQRFMTAAAKTAKSDKLSFLSTQVKNTSAFLELVTHDDDTLDNLADMDDVDKMSASELRSNLRQIKQDLSFEEDKRAKAESRADRAEKKLGGKRPVAVPLSERLLPFQSDMAKRQAQIEADIAAHLADVAALDQWWTDEVTSDPDYDPEKAAPLPAEVALAAQSLHDAFARLAVQVGAIQFALDDKFGVDLAEARQYLMQVPEAATGGDHVAPE